MTYRRMAGVDQAIREAEPLIKMFRLEWGPLDNTRGGARLVLDC